jgi:hypothetical protein
VDALPPAPFAIIAEAPDPSSSQVAVAPIEQESPPARLGGRTGRPLELGATTFLLSGIGTSGVQGLGGFFEDPLSTDVVLRMGVGAGKAFEGDLPTTWLGGRLDTCWVATGNYATGQGLTFGICGGADVGATLFGGAEGRAGQTLPFIAVGPSAELGAELGARVTLLLRAGVGLSIARDSFVDGSGERIDPSLGIERAEVGLSWKLE